MHELGRGAPGMGASLYPLAVDRVLQLTFRLFRFRWRAFAGLSLVVGLPMFMIVALLQVTVGDDLARAQQAQLDLAAGRPVSLADVLPLRALLVSYFAIVVLGVAGYLAQAAVIALMAATYAGRRASATEALRAVVRRSRPLVAGALIVLMAVLAVIVVGALAGGLLFVATMSGGRIQPGVGVFGGLLVIVAALALVVFLSVRWAFLAQVVMLEDISAGAALRRSWQLASGASWRILGYSVMFAVLLGVVGLLVDTFATAFLGTGLELVNGRLVFEPVPYLMATMINAVVSLGLAPISIIGLTLLYFDLRWRRGEPPLAATEAA